MTLIKRSRRLRESPAVRQLIQESWLSKADLVMPVFIKEDILEAEPIYSMPGIYRHSLHSIQTYCKQLEAVGIQAIALFPCISDSKKTSQADDALNLNNIYFKAIECIKKACPNLAIITDVALDPFSSDGHDGLVEKGCILNDETIALLSKCAVLQARAGADIIAPSDMMDGRVAAIRSALDEAAFKHLPIMSYAAKFASSFYSPFREALDSAPRKGDKKTYQLHPANRREALRDALLDEEEGADFLLVKPASMYLDIISDLYHNSDLPIVGFHVSGEYSMLKLAQEKGVLDYEQGMIETLTCIKRAGASLIVTYCAYDCAMTL